jgi:hypothetical protein
MMASIGLNVHEIVITRDNALQYMYFHLQKRVKEEDVSAAIETLESCGVKCSEIFGYSSVTSSTPSALEFIEDHPGFQTLVEHESQSNREFYRWVTGGYNPLPVRGYTLLKNKLLAKRGQAAGGSGGGASTGGMGGSASSDEQEPRPRNEEQNKRQRTASPDGGGQNMVSLSVMVDTMNAAIASAVSSSGSAASSAVLVEQQRREHMERQFRELQMKEERRRIEEEVVAKYKAVIEEMQAKVDGVDKIKEEHAAKMKAKDEEALLIETARKELEVELDTMRRSKVVVYFIPGRLYADAFL